MATDTEDSYRNRPIPTKVETETMENASQQMHPTIYTKHQGRSICQVCEGGDDRGIGIVTSVFFVELEGAAPKLSKLGVLSAASTLEA